MIDMYMSPPQLRLLYGVPVLYSSLPCHKPTCPFCYSRPKKGDLDGGWGDQNTARSTPPFVSVTCRYSRLPPHAGMAAVQFLYRIYFLQHLADEKRLKVSPMNWPRMREGGLVEKRLLLKDYCLYA